MGKRILIFTNHFYPENFKVNDIAFSLAEQKYHVHVITCVPNYPQGVFYKGYGLFKKNSEIIHGVKVSRLPLIPRGSGSAWRLFLNYTSYLVSTCIFSIGLCFGKKFDVVFVHETSPVTIAIPAIIYKWIRKTPVIMWVLDLWPESIHAASNFHIKGMTRFLRLLVKFIYKSCDYIFISSKGFLHKINEVGVDASRIAYLPNWAEDVFLDATLKRMNGNTVLPLPGNGFTIMYTGNLGDAQDFELIMETAKMLKDHKDIKFVFVGDGRKRAFIQEYVDDHNLNQSVFLMGHHPVEHIPHFLRQSDVLLLSLKQDPIFELTVPAKLQTYMASGKPVLGFITGESSDIIEEAQCGIVCKQKTSPSLYEAILVLKNMEGKELSRMGENGKQYFLQNFRKTDIIGKLKHQIDILAN